jgi:mannose-1-phosphate guanylyltransferase
MNKNIYCVIMAGGIGSRFWPMSRMAYPKQFIDILGTGETLLQMTYRRLSRVCPADNILIVTNEQYTSLVKEQLPKIKDEQILNEPARRNTAPCIAYACYKIYSKNPNASIVVSPSDHLILKEDTFVKAIKSCLHKAQSEDCLVTLGIKPSRPDTGYGYIQFLEGLVDDTDKRIKKVKTFTEKPDLEMARFFIQSGDFLWNSGIFIWTAQSIVNAFEKHMPETDALFKEATEDFYSPREKDHIKRIYSVVGNISIDYGVLEKADNVYVRSSIIGWSDLGTWVSLYTHVEHDKDGNANIHKNALFYESKGCLVNVQKKKLALIEGLNDYIVVDTPDVLLICKKEDEQQIRQFVNDVKMKKGEKFV